MEISQHFRAILCFVECAQQGSFAGAARKLSISSSAVSKNIANLEKVMNIRLMNRTTRKLTLTEEGERFLAQSQVAIQALDNAVSQLAASQAVVSGHLRISTSVAFGHRYLLPLIPGLKQHYPHVAIEIDFDDRVTDIIADGYDIVIRGGRILDSSLIARPICKIPLVLVASPAYLAQHGVPRDVESLLQHPLIGRRFLGGKISPWSFKQEDSALRIIEPPPHHLCLSSPESQVDAARLGLGIAQVGLHQAIEDLQAGDLLALMTDQHEPGNYEMVIQYPHRAFTAPRVKACVAYLLDALTQDERLQLTGAMRSRYQAK